MIDLDQKNSSKLHWMKSFNNFYRLEEITDYKYQKPDHLIKSKTPLKPQLMLKNQPKRIYLLLI